jgi:hypothetical protein
MAGVRKAQSFADVNANGPERLDAGVRPRLAQEQCGPTFVNRRRLQTPEGFRVVCFSCTRWKHRSLSVCTENYDGVVRCNLIELLRRHQRQVLS